MGKLYQCPWQSTEVNVPGFLISAVTPHDSPETVLGRNSVLEFGLRMYFSRFPKFPLDILVGQFEMTSLWDYLIPQLECLLFVIFFSILRWSLSFLVTNYHSLHFIPNIKMLLVYFRIYPVSLCSIIWINLPEIFQIFHFFKKCMCIYIYIFISDLFQVAQHIAKDMTMRIPLTDFVTVNCIESYCKRLVFYMSSVSRLKLIPGLRLCQTVCRKSR